VKETAKSQQKWVWESKNSKEKVMDKGEGLHNERKVKTKSMSNIKEGWTLRRQWSRWTQRIRRLAEGMRASMEESRARDEGDRGVERIGWGVDGGGGGNNSDDLELLGSWVDVSKYTTGWPFCTA
jgi:hypothetical protein